MASSANDTIASPTLAHVVTVASGKGGVGKSTVVANLAVSLARLGRRVLVLDADFSLANIDVLLGLAPRFTIQHFFAGECGLLDLIVDGPAGIHIIPAASGVAELSLIDPARRRALLEELDGLRREHDCLLIDAPAGIGENVIHLAGAADRTAIVVSPEPTSLVDAYATVKVLATSAGVDRLGLIVNGARDEAETKTVHAQIDRVCRRFLGTGIDLIGSVLHDAHVQKAVREQQAVVEAHPGCVASRCFQRLAVRIGREGNGVASDRPMFWERLLDLSDEAPHH
jgi:flagellar biosynthesis protein FlhG